MPIAKSLSFLAPLLIVTVLAAAPQQVSAHAQGPVGGPGISVSQNMSTGPLDVVYFRVSGS